MNRNTTNQLLTNAGYSVLQVLVTGVCLFFLYKFLLTALGAEQLGVWSLVLATASVTQLGNVGISGGTVRFVAKYHALNDVTGISSVVQTATASVGVIVAIVLAGCYPLVRLALSLFLAPTSFSLALEILPFALGSLWLTSVASVFIGGLEGFQRFNARSAIQGSGAILRLIICFMLVPKYGLLGMAYSTVLLNVFVLILSWILLKSSIPALYFIPRVWSLDKFKELARYGVSFQAITFISQLYDPITKGFINWAGGLAFLGYYEMANRLVIQVRALVVAANQVVVPHFADINETTRQDIPATYRKMYNMLVFVSLSLFSFLIAAMPLISFAWIGRYERIFVLAGVLLSSGWLVNTVTVPAYFVYLGTGELKWNLLSHVAIGVFNIALGMLLGFFWGGIGPVIGWSIAVALGSLLVLVPYHFKISIPMRDLFPRESVPLGFAALGAISSAMLLKPVGVMGLAFSGAQLVALAGVVFLSAWIHPARRMFFEEMSRWW